MWRLHAKELESVVEFDSIGNVKAGSSGLPWKKWSVQDGILVISKDKGTSEFYLESEDRPSTLKGLSVKESVWRLVGEN